jgi:CDGSH-type Zn-finger protein
MKRCSPMDPSKSTSPVLSLGNGRHPNVVKRRTLKACVACRVSKTKCNGEDPCARCKERVLMCVPGAERRSRKAIKHVLPQPAPPISKEIQSHGADFSQSKDSKDQENLLNHEIHFSITGSEASVSSPMHLCYGPSSAFVFLQQLHRFLFKDLSSKPATISGRSANYTAEAISEFGYGSIFYGAKSSGSVAFPPEISGQPIGSVFHDSGSSELPPFDLAANFLEMYLSAAQHVLPFCEIATLRKLFYSLYSAPETYSQSSRDHTLVIAILAFGASLTQHIAMSHSLFLKAEKNVSTWGDAVSLRVVQVLMLLSEISHTQGRPNSAICICGAAVNKAFAAGLHRDIVHSSRFAKDLTELDCMRIKERQNTFWTLYALDRRLSLTMGRPASINEMDIDIPEPSGGPHLEATVKLSRIAHKVYYGVYGRKRGSVADFCLKIQEIRDELLEFHKNLPPVTKFPRNEAELNDCDLQPTTSQMILAFGKKSLSLPVPYKYNC